MYHSTISGGEGAPLSKRNIKNLSIEEISSLIEDLGEQRHRKRQILQWLYQKNSGDFSEMTNLPLTLRKRLSELFFISTLSIVDSVRSKSDKSQKFLLKTDDGALIESVLMESKGHQTICISSQVGCPLACTFCSTGASGFERNLRCDEILNQVIFFKSKYIPPRKRFNIVFMGMGEPLLNIENVSRAIEILNAMDAFALGEKRITVSTLGFPDRIGALAASNLKFNLAVSLNATTESKRKKIMPQAGNLRKTLEAAEHFAVQRKTRVTLEYVLIGGFNDSPEDAKRLSSLTAGRPFKINIIPFNGWKGSEFREPSDQRINEFVRRLLPKAPAVTVRRSQGSDIDAACGQLRIRGITERGASSR